jgi:hypothetical protein
LRGTSFRSDASTSMMSSGKGPRHSTSSSTVQRIAENLLQVVGQVGLAPRPLDEVRDPVEQGCHPPQLLPGVRALRHVDDSIRIMPKS